jgi:hypothetical protein
LGGGTEGNGPYHNVAGASFDSTTKRLYLFGVYSSDYSNRIYVYDVNC